jgi:hypothetical protein
MSTNEKIIQGIIGETTYVDFQNNTRKVVFHDRVVYIKGNTGHLFHREDGPAVNYNDGHIIWYYNGLKHNLNGYAELFPDGSKYWFKHGKFHNEVGPARIMYASLNYTLSSLPTIEFWLNGKYYPGIKSDEEWLIKQILE